MQGDHQHWLFLFRESQKDASEYMPYAGHYDITLVKLNRFVNFEINKVIIKKTKISRSGHRT